MASLTWTRRNRRRRGRGLVPVCLSSRARQKINGRVSYFLHEAGCGICQADLRDGVECKTSRNVLLRELFFCLTQQDSLSLTPPTAWRKRQASRYHCVNRSGHVFIAGDGLPLGVLWQRRPEKALKIPTQN